MVVLLDTCAIVWAVAAPDALSAKARAVLTAGDTEVCVSPISSAEIACAVERGRLALDRHWKPWFRQFVELNGWRVVDIGLDAVEEAYSLPPPFHRDPADRLIVATARLLAAAVVTSDQKILDYPHVRSIW
ncbi:MAG: type II toxin-antitoxin system VapC family toxin [Acidobacteria bacterium]|nr:type II toxin-antitoxin system VapC family toxin [Acidobacteriota bacterium]